MDKQQATTLISSTFENAFDEGQYLRFLRELFNGQIDESDDRKFDLYGQYIPDSFKESVRRYKRLGTYTDSDGHEVDLLIVILKREQSLDRARTMQRNFAAYHLKRREKETAIIAYTTEERGDWRFSMVRREPVVAFSEKGNLIARDELTPVRRYSFLVGQNERSHTAQQQLFPILVDDKNDPTLNRLENAFNIETVTKEFFERYKGLFLQLKEELDRLTTQNPRVQAEFEAKGLETANFAKKLLGQIVFLYFLQKKGWLGVRPGDNWGAGSRHFVRELFERNSIAYSNFFNDVLEPLFYEALAIERPDNVYTRLNVKIPFLNGGLFEPVGNYDWRNIDMLIDNGVFKSIFDTFDLYNFTVREDEPLEKEVAVDPEMLGKVFENLLEVTDRKSKGAFYTPREIVHYMCQESLINYLDTRVNIVTRSFLEPENPAPTLFELPPIQTQQPTFTETVYKQNVVREDLSILIRFGELAVQNDLAKESGTVSYKYHMPESIRIYAQKLDEALASVKICDPAIGSGAFPVGIMLEIVKAREVLTTYLGNRSQRSTYNFKRQAIQESIYGVDIDSSAIEIAKLRMWLSLVVDEEDYQDIKPLPNLDYKIVCGNVLMSVEKDVFNYPVFNKLEELKAIYFDETDPDKKSELRDSIEGSIEKLTDGNKHFDIRIYFSEVFREKDGHKGGFDVVIGNPPYLRIQGIRENAPQLANFYKKNFRSATGSFDLYVLFAEKGLEILNHDGLLNFIMPDKWTNAGFGQGLRKLIADQKNAQRLISFGAYQIFNASTYSSLLWLTKRPNPKLGYVGFDQDLSSPYELANALNRLQQDNFNSIESSSLSAEVWVLTNRAVGDVLQRMQRQLRRVSQVFSHIYQGIATSRDSVYFLSNCKSDGNLLEGYSNELEKRVSVEIGLMKPLLKGDQVHRYVNLATDINVLFPYSVTAGKERNQVKLLSKKDLQLNYPLGWIYLCQCEEVLKSRENGAFDDAEWYRFSRNQGIFFENKPKLVSPDISLGGNFAFDGGGQFYMTTTVYGYIKNPEIKESYAFWLALMNSKLLWFYLQNTGTVLANGYFRYKPAFLENFPVPEKIEPQYEQVFVALADYISHIKAQVDVKSTAHARDAVMLSYFEQLIDALVYELYFPEEIHGSGRNFMSLLQRENLPNIPDDADETYIRVLRQLFERLFKTDHPLREAIFYLDSLELVRIIEGKA